MNEEYRHAAIIAEFLTEHIVDRMFYYVDTPYIVQYWMDYSRMYDGVDWSDKHMVIYFWLRVYERLKDKYYYLNIHNIIYYWILKERLGYRTNKFLGAMPPE